MARTKLTTIEKSMAGNQAGAAIRGPAMYSAADRDDAIRRAAIRGAKAIRDTVIRGAAMHGTATGGTVTRRNPIRAAIRNAGKGK